MGKIQRLRLQDHPAHQHRREFQGRGHRRRLHVQNPLAQPRLPGRGLHHRPAPGGAELRRRRPLLGPVRAAADAAAGPAVRPGGQRRPPDLVRGLHRDLPEHRQDRGHRRHADERGLYAVQDAQEPDRRHPPLGRRRQEGGHQPAGHAAHRQGHQHQDRLFRPARHGRDHLHRLLVVHGLQPGQPGAGPGGGAGHAGRRLLLRRGLGLPGRPDRLLQQPDLGPDPLHPGHRRHPDGDPGRQGHPRA